MNVSLRSQAVWAIVALSGAAASPAPQPASKAAASVRAHAHLFAPFHFESNVGQTNRRFAFTLRGNGYGAAVSATEAWLKLDHPRPRRPLESDEASRDLPQPRAATLGVRFIDANPNAALTGVGAVDGESTYILGSRAKPARAARFRSLRAAGVYPGIDVVYRVQDGQLRFDFEVHALADPSVIALAYSGVDDISLAHDGDLVLAVGGKRLRQRVPLVYQSVHGARSRIDGRYAVGADDKVRFSIGDFDPGRPLIIDPVIEYSTFFGGSGSEGGNDLAVAANGDHVVCGTSTSLDFPVTGAVQPDPASAPPGSDVVVARLLADGSGTVFATYFGGTGTEYCYRIALDSGENVVFAGITDSADFPTFNAFDSSYAGSDDPDDPGEDGYVSKLAADGASVIFSTYLGGTDGRLEFFGIETIRGLDVDGADRIYVTGETGAPDFPVTHMLNGRVCMDEDFDAGSTFKTDNIVARFLPDGTLDFATCLGGDQRDTGRGIVVKGDGQIVVIGHTRSTDFPLTPGAVADFPPPDGFGSYDVFTTILNSDATAIEHSGRIGGTGNEFLANVALDSTGNIVIAGSSSSVDFPVTANAYQPECGCDTTLGTGDVVLVKYSPNLGALLGATYLGGSGDEFTLSVAVDAYDQILTVFSEERDDLPVRNPLQEAPAAQFPPAQIPAPSELGANAAAEGHLDGSSFGNWFFLVARNGTNLLYLDDNTGTVTLSGPLGSESLDTRAVVVADINFDGEDDIITGNYLAENYYYLNDGAVGFLPGVAFGDPASRTVSLAMIGNALFEGVEGQANQWYDSGVTPLVAQGAFGGADDATLGLAVAGGILVEAVAPDTLVYYQAAGATPVALEVTALGPGVDIASVRTAADLLPGGGEDLIIANALGRAMLVGFEDPGGAFSFSTAEIGDDDTPTTAAAYYEQGYPPLHYLVTTTATELRFHQWQDGSATLEQAFEVPSPVTALGVRAEFSSSSRIAAGGAALATRFYQRMPFDIYIAVLDAAAENLVFGSYLGGVGNESAGWGLALEADGTLTFAGSSNAPDYPVTTGAGLGGSSDITITRVRYLDDADDDGDGVLSSFDNCTLRANADQRDGDGDGIGTACDPDHDQNCVVNFLDLGLFYAQFLGNDEDFDYTGDGYVNFVDFGRFKSLFFNSATPGPGPSGVPNLCE